MDRKEFKTEINVNWPCIPAVISGEQKNCPAWKGFYVSSLETFAVAITLQYRSRSVLLFINFLTCQTLCQYPLIIDQKKLI